MSQCREVRIQSGSRCDCVTGRVAVVAVLIYLLTAVGLTPGSSSTVQCTFTHKQYIEQHSKNNTINKNSTINKNNDIINKNYIIKKEQHNNRTTQLIISIPETKNIPLFYKASYGPWSHPVFHSTATGSLSRGGGL